MMARMRWLALALATLTAACTGHGGPPPVCPSPLHPSARSDMTAVLVPDTDRVYLYGGRDANGPRGDLWLLTFGACGGWFELSPPSSPGPLAGYAAAYDSMRHRIVYIGGAGTNDVWSLDTDHLTFTKLATVGTPPVPTNAAVAAYDDMHDRIVWVGVETYELDFASSDQGQWRAVAGNSLTPPGSGTVDATRETLFLLDAKGLHAFPFLTSTWHDVGGTVPPAGAQLAWDALFNLLLAVGSVVDDVTLDGNATTASFVPISDPANGPPGPRTGFTTVGGGDALFFFGGTNGSCFFDDEWYFGFMDHAWLDQHAATSCQ